MMTKKWWGRGAATLLVTSLWLQAPALAAAPPESLGTLTPQEEKQREEFRKALRELPTAEELYRNPLAVGALDMVAPGVGTMSISNDGQAAMGTMLTIVGLDALAMLFAITSTPQKADPADALVPMAIGVGAVHLLVGGVYGAVKTVQYNAAAPIQLAEAEKHMKAQVAELDKVEKERAAAVQQRQTAARARNVAEARALQAQRKYGLALMRIQSRDYDGDTEIVALRAEINAALDEAKARDQAYRLKKGRELLDKILADAARYAAQRDYERALILLDDVPNGIPAAWKQEVTQRANQYRQAEARAGGREKLHQERNDAVKQQLFAAIRSGDRAGALKKLDEFNALATSGMMGGRGFLLSEGAGKVQRGNMSQGEILLLQGQVETVVPGGIMLRVQDPVGGTMTFLARAHGMQTNERVTRVFVKAGNMGVVDGDTVMIGVQAAGTYSYTTVAGGRGTVRAVELKTHLQ